MVPMDALCEFPLLVIDVVELLLERPLDLVTHMWFQDGAVYGGYGVFKMASCEGINHSRDLKWWQTRS